MLEEKVKRAFLLRQFDCRTDDNTTSGMLEILTKYVKFVEDPTVFEAFENDSQAKLFEKNKDPINGLLKGVMKSETNHEHYTLPFIFQSMHPCNEMLLYCEWQGKAKDCETLFRVSKSDNGFCCSFNIVTTRQQFE